jgi:phosphoglycerate dehydrogenase-like enzyme
MKKLGIAVANVPGGSNSAVAEYAVGCAIVLLRRLAWSDMEIREANYVSFRGRMMADNLPGLEGLTVGVVGMGTVGFAVAEAFRRFSCEIVYSDPTPRGEAAAKIGAKAVSLEELLKSSDIVSLHVPLLPQTRSMIGARQIGMMKPGAILIQASRGGIVNETALAAHLNSGHLGGAAVDVYSVEPPDTDNPLFALEGEAAHRVLYTPHVAGVTRQSAATLFREAWANVERVLLKGEEPQNRAF